MMMFEHSNIHIYMDLLTRIYAKANGKRLEILGRPKTRSYCTAQELTQTSGKVAKYLRRCRSISMVNKAIEMSVRLKV